MFGLLTTMVGEVTPPVVDGATIQTGVNGLITSIQSMMPVVLPILFLVLGYKFIPKIVKMFAK